MVNAAQVSIASTATLISSNVSRAFTPYSCLVINQGSASVFVGPTSAVTTSTGLELKANASISVLLATNETLYGIVATGTQRVDILENGK